jgi:hypothetical protein
MADPRQTTNGRARAHARARTRSGAQPSCQIKRSAITASHRRPSSPHLACARSPSVRCHPSGAGTPPCDAESPCSVSGSPQLTCSRFSTPRKSESVGRGSGQLGGAKLCASWDRGSSAQLSSDLVDHHLLAPERSAREREHARALQQRQRLRPLPAASAELERARWWCASISGQAKAQRTGKTQPARQIGGGAAARPRTRLITSRNVAAKARVPATGVRRPP